MFIWLRVAPNESDKHALRRYWYGLWQAYLPRTLPHKIEWWLPNVNHHILVGVHVVAVHQVSLEPDVELLRANKPRPNNSVVMSPYGFLDGFEVLIERILRDTEANTVALAPRGPRVYDVPVRTDWGWPGPLRPEGSKLCQSVFVHTASPYKRATDLQLWQESS